MMQVNINRVREESDGDGLAYLVDVVKVNRR
jgi:hypothetical protein